MTGAAPVPVPPPRPVVTNTMSAPDSAWIRSSVSSSAACRPTLGSAPAPRPLVSLLPIWIFIGAGLLCSACASVLATMNSTPLRPGLHHARHGVAAAAADADHLDARAGAGRLVDRQPQLVVRAVPACHRTDPPSSLLVEPQKNSLNTPRSCPTIRVSAPPPTARLRASDAAPHRAPGRPPCIGRVGDVVGEAADAGGRAAPDRQIEDLLGDLGHAVEQRAAAGEHEAGVERLLVAGLADLVPHQMEDLFGARLQDVAQDAPRHDARPAAADAGHLDRLVLLDHRRQRAAAAPLDLLGLGNRRAQADGDVVGEVIAADGDHRGVPEAAALEDREVGGAAADVEQRDAELLLVRRQHRFGRRQLADHRIDHLDAGAVDARRPGSASPSRCR